MPSVYETAAMTKAVRQAGYAEWLPALRQTANSNTAIWTRGNGARRRIQAVIGKPPSPSPTAPYATSCKTPSRSRDGKIAAACQNAAGYATYAAAVVGALRHLTRRHRRQPPPREIAPGDADRLKRALQRRGLERWLPAVQRRQNAGDDITQLRVSVSGQIKNQAVINVGNSAAGGFYTAYCELPRHRRGDGQCHPECARIAFHYDYADAVIAAIRHAQNFHRRQPPGAQPCPASTKSRSSADC